MRAHVEFHEAAEEEGDYQDEFEGFDVLRLFQEDGVDDHWIFEETEVVLDTVLIRTCGSGEVRTFLRRRGIRSTIPRKSNGKRRGPFDIQAYRKRNKFEHLIGRVREFPRIATRHEKRAANYLAMWFIGIILLWL